MLPYEIIYEIMDWLNSFDILNVCYVFKITPNKKYYLYINDEIDKYCSSDKYFIRIMNDVIDKMKMIDYNIIHMLDSIVYIIKKTLKYMDILGFDTYVFNIKKGPSFISKHSMPIIYKNTQIINVYYQDVDVLKYYLENFMNFKIGDFNSKIKKYNMKFLLK